MSLQTAYENTTLGRHLQAADQAQNDAEAVEREMEILYGQRVGDLVRAAPLGWRQRLDDILNEIAEALVQRRTLVP